MALLTIPSVVKGTSASISLDKAELFMLSAVSFDSYFSVPENVKRCIIEYKSNPGDQRKLLVFNLSETSPAAPMLVSSTGRDSFQIECLVLEDNDGGILVIKRAELPIGLDISIGGGGSATIQYVPHFEMGGQYSLFWLGTGLENLYVGVQRREEDLSWSSSPVALLGSASTTFATVSTSQFTSGETYRLSLYSDPMGLTSVIASSSEFVLTSAPPTPQILSMSDIYDSSSLIDVYIDNPLPNESWSIIAVNSAGNTLAQRIGPASAGWLYAIPYVGQENLVTAGDTVTVKVVNPDGNAVSEWLAMVQDSTPSYLYPSITTLGTANPADGLLKGQYQVSWVTSEVGTVEIGTVTGPNGMGWTPYRSNIGNTTINSYASVDLPYQGSYAGQTYDLNTLWVLKINNVYSSSFTLQVPTDWGSGNSAFDNTSAYSGNTGFPILGSTELIQPFLLPYNNEIGYFVSSVRLQIPASLNNNAAIGAEITVELSSAQFGPIAGMVGSATVSSEGLLEVNFQSPQLLSASDYNLKITSSSQQVYIGMNTAYGSVNRIAVVLPSGIPVHVAGAEYSSLKTVVFRLA